MNISISSLNTWLRRFGRPQAQVPDINLIPADHQGRRLLSGNSGFAILVVLELILVVSLFRIYGQESVTTVREYLGMEETPGPVSEPEDRLALQIKQARQNLNDLSSAGEVISRMRVSWPQLLDVIFNQVPEGVSVTSLRPSATEINMTGTAAEHSDILAYRDALTESPFVAQVIVPTIGVDPGESKNKSFTFKITALTGVAVE